MQPEIPNYRIVRILGSGGMGVVYLADHLALNRKVAIKVLMEHYNTHDEVRMRFLQEARLMDSLSHPNIVKLYDFLEKPCLCLVMEYIDGRSLEQLIGREVGPLPWKRAVDLFRQIVSGIGYAHSKGIVHRDVKPSNILLSGDSRVSITDLGIAKIKGKAGLTKTGAKIGTVSYMAPEQVLGSEADERTDIYALGLTLYEMLAGALPLGNAETSEYKLMNAIVNRTTPLDPREHYPHIPQWMVSIVAKATETAPENRYASCREILDDLDAGMTKGDEGITYRAASPIQHESLPGPPESRSASHVPSFSKGKRIGLITAGLAAVLLVTIGLKPTEPARMDSRSQVANRQNVESEAVEEQLSSESTSVPVVSVEAEIAETAIEFFSELERMARNRQGSVAPFLTSDVFIGFEQNYPDGSRMDRGFFDRCFQETSSIQILDAINENDVLVTGSNTAQLSYTYRSFDTDGTPSWRITLGFRKVADDWLINRYSFSQI